MPYFIVNARADPLLHDGQLSEVIECGEAYLATGATTVFVLGSQAGGGISRSEIIKHTRVVGGRLNVARKLDDGNLTGTGLASTRVARISLGQQLQFIAMRALTDAAKVLEG
jgi:2-methylisocitrate lyase-like PEP mutase family enzyme